MSSGPVAGVSSLPVSKTPGQFGLWLREELTRRGYLDQRGGLSQFARAADVHLSIISRVVNEGRAPEIDALRRIGKVLGYSLGEMLIFAGIATADELPVRPVHSGTASGANGTAALPDVLRELRASAATEGKTVGELLVEHGLAVQEELVIPPSLPPDPIIMEIEASDLPEETKVNLIRMHLENRSRRFEEARLERQRRRKPDA
jgi:hypothetical protein